MLQFEAHRLIRTALCWVITQQVVEFLTTFRGNLSVPSSRFKNSWNLKSAVLSYFAAEAWNHAC